MKLTQVQLSTLYGIKRHRKRDCWSSEVAAVIGRYHLTIINWVDRGIMPGYRKGVHICVRPEDLENWEFPVFAQGPKLSRQDVIHIRRQKRQGVDQDAVYTQYENTVSRTAFDRVWDGKSYRDI